MVATPSISFEFFPPAPGGPEARFWEAVARLAPLAPAFMSVTYGAGGTARDRSDHVIRGLLARNDVTPAAHITCVGAPRAEVDAVVTAWAAAGVTRIVALRGDMPGVERPVPFASRGLL